MPSDRRHRAPVLQGRRLQPRAAYPAVSPCTHSRRSVLSVERWGRPGLCLTLRPMAATLLPRLGSGP
eukprot:5523760-Alexandrium_andersonii.AAC.1